LDGTVYKGSNAVAGAADTIDWLRGRGKRLVFLSNRGNISRERCQANLAGMGIEVEREEIVLTSSVAAAYLKRHHEAAAVWTLGDEGLRDELRLAGVSLAAFPEAADWLLITLCETLTYTDLNDAFRAVRNGAKIMATNADRMFPGQDGLSIDVAGMIGAITATTGQTVELTLGKPSALMANAALDALGLPPERCLIVGDSLESDIRLGKRSGMMTALVLTGSATREEAEASRLEPDWICGSIADLRQLMPTTANREGDQHDRTCIPD
jgi:sugar-phosphatase